MNERELRVLRSIANEMRALQQEIQAARKQYQSTEDANHNQPIHPLRVEVTVTPQLDPAQREYYQSENRDSKSLWRKLKPWVETVGVLIAVALAVFNLLVLLEIQKQTPDINKSAKAAARGAKAASDQVALMAEQLAPFMQIRIDTNTSPWEGGNSPFPYPTGVRVSLQNIGSTPATNVHVVLAIDSEPIRSGKGARRTIRREDFTIPRIETVSSGMSLIRNMVALPPTTRGFSFALPQDETTRFPRAGLRLISEGVMSYTTEFKKTITESFCYVYWSYWSRDGRGQSAQIGSNSITCSDFDNSVAPRLSEMIETQVRQQQKQ